MKIILVDAWNTFVKKKEIDIELFKILESFTNKKIILTNADEIERKEFGIINMPYQVFSLSHNPEKTDIKYYKILCDQFKLKVSNLLYIEHNNKAFKTAVLFGIKSYLYTGNNQNVKKFLEDNCYE